MSELPQKVTRILLMVPPVGTMMAIAVPELRENFAFITTLVFATIYILLINFPSFIRSLHSRPIYYEDLEDCEADNDAERGRFQRYFVHLMMVPVALFSASLFDYIVYKVHSTRLSTFEILGVIFGNVGMLGTAQFFLGSVLLFVLHWSKTRKQTRRRSSSSCSHPEDDNV